MIKKIFVRLFIIIASWLNIFFSIAFPKDFVFRDKISLGVSIEETAIPLIRGKFKISKNDLIELRFGTAHAQDGGVENEPNVSLFLYGVRWYNKLSLIQRKLYDNIYLGVEIDSFNSYFRSSNIGQGYVFGSFVGIEKYVNKWFSVNLDVGPYYVYMKHKNFDISVDTIDIVFNILFNFYIK